MEPTFLTRPSIQGHFGVAAATHWLAAQTAMRMLELGGNAFDGAAAAGFVLQVAEPHLNGPLGEVPIMLYQAERGETAVICGQGTAPKLATIDHFQRLGVKQIPGTGLLAAAIPGAFDAWMLLLRDHGTLPLKTILMPAIEYAEKGVPVVPRLAKAINTMKSWFLAEWPSNADIYLPGGEVPETGSLLCNPALAATWRKTLDEAASAGSGRVAQVDAARAAWKTGFVGRAIAEFCASQSFRDVTGQRNGGLITLDDLAGWSAKYEKPVSVEFNSYHICKCGPWSQGPVLLQGLRLIEALGPRCLQGEVNFYHTLTEIMKLTYADRETYYGDPDVVDVPLTTLLGREYAAARAQLIGEQANNTWRPGRITGFGHPVDYHAACNVELDAETLAALGIGEPTVAKHEDLDSAVKSVVDGDTCHINVADRWGNIVAATPSGGWMESSPVIPELGVSLGTRLQMMRLTVGAPDALAPGVRPRTTLTPTIVLDEKGKGYMGCGTPGGDKQDQWQLAFLLRHLALGMTPQEAIEAPSFYSTHWPDSFFPRQAFPGKLSIEGRVSQHATEALRARGHDLHVEAPWSDGYLTASFVNKDNSLGAAASPRGQQAYAVGR
jgi:gamma-glutamyltranspeptidase/glutathione hydrolase